MIIKYNNKKTNLPDFLIVGAAKCGTTSLYYYLEENNDIYMSKPKETWFFSFLNKKPVYKSPQTLGNIYTSFKKYAKLFEKDDVFKKVIGEASPSYLYLYQKTINNIKLIYGDSYKKLKIIIILRNPADRAWSMYNHFRKTLDEPLEFKEAIRLSTIKKRMKNDWNPFYDYIKVGKYYEQVKAYLDNFDNVKIIMFDELKKDSQQVLNEICEFLKVKPNNFKDEKHNTGGVYNKKLFFIKKPYKWFINHDNLLRKITRKIVPIKTRYSIDKFVKSAFMAKKEEINIYVKKDIIKKYYLNDLNRLKNMN